MEILHLLAAEMSLCTGGSLVRYFSVGSLVPLVYGCHSVHVASSGSCLVFHFAGTLPFLDYPSVALAGPCSRTAVCYHTLGRPVGHDCLGIVAFYLSRTCLHEKQVTLHKKRNIWNIPLDAAKNRLFFTKFKKYIDTSINRFKKYPQNTLN